VITSVREVTSAEPIALVDISISKKLRSKSPLLLLTEDNLYLNNKLAVRNCVIDSSVEELKAQIANFTNTDRKVKSGTVLAICEQINERKIKDIGLEFTDIKNESVSSLIKNSTEQMSNKSGIRRDENGIEYEEMFIFNNTVKIGSELSDAQVEELKKILEKFPELFAFNDERIGRIRGYEHKIETTTENPIYCTPARFIERNAIYRRRN
jgi:hypothetical protein